jgi:hypothetical protein
MKTKPKNSNSEIFDAIASLMSKSRMTVLKYSPNNGKVKNITLGTGGSVSVYGLYDKLHTYYRKVVFTEEFPQELTLILKDMERFKEFFEGYCKSKGLTEEIEEEKSPEIPDEIKKYNLYYNMQATDMSPQNSYILTEKEDNSISQASSVFYVKSMLSAGFKEMDIFNQATRVFPRYLPRKPPGTGVISIGANMEIPYLNTYSPPEWMRVKENSIPNKLPQLFIDLIDHMIKLPEEKEYFYDWLYTSLFERSYVYLMLCGFPGVGKNTLKEVMEALHGRDNTVDGKKSTLVDRFNSQLEGCTLCWFDELKFGEDQENFLKEIQNDSISIEKKGVDSTKSTNIYASFVISNNKERDNFLDFDARKFAPIVLTKLDLKKVMPEDQIVLLKNKVNPSSEHYDVKFIAQIGYWIKNRGYSGKWPNLEYRGPMFWRLCHTSMARWKKRAVQTLLEAENIPALKALKTNDGYLWSSVENFIVKKYQDKNMSVDYSTVRSFFEVFKDTKGEASFTTKLSETNKVMGDFYVKKIIDKVEVHTEEIPEKKSVKESKPAKKTKENKYASLFS